VSGQGKVPVPSRKKTRRHPDLDERPLPGGPRHMASSASPVPDQWATHRLITIAARLNERRLNRRLAQLGLTTSALDALESAAELEPTTVTDLAALLCVSSQSLGKLLRRLQNLGFLTKERGRDGRTADIRLTPKGREVLSRAEHLVGTETNGEPEDETLFRQQLEQHIRRLREAELPASRQARPYRRTGANPGAHHGPEPTLHDQPPTRHSKKEQNHGDNKPGHRTQN
jgi:DNA-binding MarR family transcriptional regulator